jgi:hypothetical protein
MTCARKNLETAAFGSLALRAALRIAIGFGI